MKQQQQQQQQQHLFAAEGNHKKNKAKITIYQLTPLNWALQ